MTQNLSGIYSLIMHTFLCRTEGTRYRSPMRRRTSTGARLDAVRELVERHPDRIFPMDLIPLLKYLEYKKI